MYMKFKYSRHCTIWLMLIFLALLIYDGALRKWAFPDYERYIYLLKDVVLLAASSLIVISRKWSKEDLELPKLFLVPFLLYSFYAVVQTANPSLPSFLVGLWGIKNHLFYSLIVFVMLFGSFQLNSSLEGLQKVLPWMVIPVCLIAFFQTTAPADSWLNDPVRGGQLYVSSMINNWTRTSATFSYITGFSFYLIAFVLTSILLILRGKSKNWILVICLMFLLAAVPTNGSRSVIVVLGFSILLLIGGLAACGFLKITQLTTIAIGIAVAVILSYIALPDVWGALINRFLTSSVVPGDSIRYWTIFTNAFVFFDVAGLFGFGVGAASQAAPFLVSDLDPYSWLPTGIAALGFEEESGRLVLELGVLGWGLGLSFRIALVLLSIKILLTTRDRDGQLAAAMALPIMLYAAYVGHGIFAPPMGSAFFWFGVGLLLLASRTRTDHSSSTRGSKFI